MLKNIKRYLPLLAIVALAVLYLWPIPKVATDQLYLSVDPAIYSSLQSFRQMNQPRRLLVEGEEWEYVTLGKGHDTVLFLHGMAGAHDIWWQQINALKDQYRIVSVTYPPVRNLGKLEKGVITILDNEGVRDFFVVGTSLGGYFSQYLISRHPERVRRAVLSNTFPPNDLIAKKNRTTGMLLPFMPEWLLLSVFRGNFQKTIYPASGNDELTLAFLNEIGYSRMSKAQLLGRYYCVVEKFPAPSPEIPVMILESDNDPLVEPALREQLKTSYPKAEVHTFHGAGHFPYLNHPHEYTRLLVDFLNRP